MHEKELTPKYAALAAVVEAQLGARVERLPTSTGELGYRIESENLLDVAATFRDAADLKFEMLVDLCGVDYCTYGRDEWETNRASGTGFSRGRVAAPPDDEQQDKKSAEGESEEEESE